MRLLLTKHWSEWEASSGHDDRDGFTITSGYIDTILQLTEYRFQLTILKQKVEKDTAASSYEEFFEYCKNVLLMEIRLESFEKKLSKDVQVLLNYFEEKYFDQSR